MTKHFTHVGVREFREGIADYLKSDTPLAITRHGRIIGYYLPAEARATPLEASPAKERVPSTESKTKEAMSAVGESLPPEYRTEEEPSPDFWQGPPPEYKTREEAIAAFEKAAGHVAKLLEERGIHPEEVVREFDRLRRQENAHR